MLNPLDLNRGGGGRGVLARGRISKVTVKFFPSYMSDTTTRSSWLNWVSRDDEAVY